MRRFDMQMELIQKVDAPVEFAGRTFRAAVYAEEQWDGAFHAWVAFFTDDDKKRALLTTDRETVQPNRTALRWWSEGLTGERLLSALKRALFLETHPQDRVDERRTFSATTAPARR